MPLRPISGLRPRPGEEPDPRFTLANERTFLAWARTVLALLAGSAAVSSFALGLGEVERRALAVVLTITALLSTISSLVHWLRTERAMRLRQPLPSNPSAVLLTAALLAAAFILLRAEIP